MWWLPEIRTMPHGGLSQEGSCYVADSEPKGVFMRFRIQILSPPDAPSLESRGGYRWSYKKGEAAVGGLCSELALDLQIGSRHPHGDPLPMKEPSSKRSGTRNLLKTDHEL